MGVTLSNCGTIKHGTNLWLAHEPSWRPPTLSIPFSPPTAVGRPITGWLLLWWPGRWNSFDQQIEPMKNHCEVRNWLWYLTFLFSFFWAPVKNWCSFCGPRTGGYGSNGEMRSSAGGASFATVLVRARPPLPSEASYGHCARMLFWICDDLCSNNFAGLSLQFYTIFIMRHPRTEGKKVVLTTETLAPEGNKRTKAIECQYDKVLGTLSWTNDTNGR